jgi:hypothetical protein
VSQNTKQNKIPNEGLAKKKHTKLKKGKTSELFSDDKSSSSPIGDGEESEEDKYGKSKEWKQIFMTRWRTRVNLKKPSFNMYLFKRCL